MRRIARNTGKIQAGNRRDALDTDEESERQIVVDVEKKPAEELKQTSSTTQIRQEGDFYKRLLITRSCQDLLRCIQQRLEPSPPTSIASATSRPPPL